MIEAALIPCISTLVAGALAFGVMWAVPAMSDRRRRARREVASEVVSSRQALDVGRCLIRKRLDPLRRA